METLIQDLRYGARSSASNGVTLVAVLTLAYMGCIESHRP